jgi:hypothetical protein
MNPQITQETLDFARKMFTYYKDFHTNKKNEEERKLKEEQLKRDDFAKNCFALAMENFKKHVESTIIEGKNEIIYDIPECEDGKWMTDYKRIINKPSLYFIYHDLNGNLLNTEEIHKNFSSLESKTSIVPDDCLIFRLGYHCNHVSSKMINSTEIIRFDEIDNIFYVNMKHWFKRIVKGYQKKN